MSDYCSPLQDLYPKQPMCLWMEQDRSNVNLDDWKPETSKQEQPIPSGLKDSVLHGPLEPEHQVEYPTIQNIEHFKYNKKSCSAGLIISFLFLSMIAICSCYFFV